MSDVSDRPVPVQITTADPQWRDLAIDFLLNDDDVEIMHTGQAIVVRAAWLRPRQPVWQTIRKVLKEHGVAVRYRAAPPGWRR